MTRPPYQSAAIVCAHVATDGHPILQANYDEAAFPEDSGWQFLCNVFDHNDEASAKMWSLGQVARADPSVEPLLHFTAPGTTYWRTSRGAPWQRTRDAPEP